MVAVAVFGLYGAATNKWEMSAKIEQAGVFDGFWDTLAYITNAIVFFYSGVACINFLVRYANYLPVSELVRKVSSKIIILSKITRALYRMPCA